MSNGPTRRATSSSCHTWPDRAIGTVGAGGKTCCGVDLERAGAVRRIRIRIRCRPRLVSSGFDTKQCTYPRARKRGNGLLQDTGATCNRRSRRLPRASSMGYGLCAMKSRVKQMSLTYWWTCSGDCVVLPLEASQTSMPPDTGMARLPSIAAAMKALPLKRSPKAARSAHSPLAPTSSDQQRCLHVQSVDATLATEPTPPAGGSPTATPATSSVHTLPTIAEDLGDWLTPSPLVASISAASSSSPALDPVEPPRPSTPAPQKWTARRERRTGYIRWTAEDGSEMFLSPDMGLEASGMYMRKRRGLPVSLRYQ